MLATVEVDLETLDLRSSCTLPGSKQQSGKRLSVTGDPTTHSHHSQRSELEIVEQVKDSSPVEESTSIWLDCCSLSEDHLCHFFELTAR